MIYVTGDIHGGFDIGKLNTRNFPEQKEMTKDDFVIICGDFGMPWGGKLSGEDRYWLKWLEDKPFTTLYVDGNHENFDLLETYPVEDWNGGKIQKLNSSVFHLCRGSVFTLQGATFFAFGGAKSHDIAYRIPHRSWWPQEEPSPAECEAGLAVLDAMDWKVDYVLTHTAPLTLSPYKDGCSTEKYLDAVYQRLTFGHWFCGHFHIDKESEADPRFWFMDQNVLRIR